MIVRIALLLGVLALAVTGCMGDDGPELVTRDDVSRAYAAAGETLRPSHTALIAEESPIEVIYEPPQERENVGAPFGVILLENEDAATRHVVSIRIALAGAPNVVVERNKNVVIAIYPSIPAERRKRLLDVFQSL